MISKLFESRFEKLIQKQADDALTPAESDELKNICERSREKARALSEYTKLLTALKSLPKENAPSHLRRNILMRLEKRRASVRRLARLEQTFVFFRYPVEIGVILCLAAAVGVLYWLMHS